MFAITFVTRFVGWNGWCSQLIAASFPNPGKTTSYTRKRVHKTTSPKADCWIIQMDKKSHFGPRCLTGSSNLLAVKRPFNWEQKWTETLLPTTKKCSKKIWITVSHRSEVTVMHFIANAKFRALSVCLPVRVSVWHKVVTQQFSKDKLTTITIFLHNRHTFVRWGDRSTNSE